MSGPGDLLRQRADQVEIVDRPAAGEHRQQIRRPAQAVERGLDRDAGGRGKIGHREVPAAAKPAPNRWELVDVSLTPLTTDLLAPLFPDLSVYSVSLSANALAPLRGLGVQADEVGA